MLTGRSLKKNEKRLNVDIPLAITEFKSVMKEFHLKKDIYKILFRGKGLEFEAFRDYGPDDDASYIDWKASSRAQKLLVKQYKEERDLKIVFIIDVGSNMVFGSQEKLKCEYIAEIVGAFSRLIMDEGDQVGFFIFSDKLKYFIKPKRGEKHFQFFVDVLSRASTYGGVTNIEGGIDFAMKYLDRSINSVIFISDFLKFGNQTERKINLLAHLFETIVIRVRDPLDFTLPNVEGEIAIENPESGEQVIVNPRVARASYEKYAHEQARFVQKSIEKSEADFLDLVTSKRFAVPLALFLKERVLKK